MSTSEQKSSLETSAAFGNDWQMAYFFEKAKGIIYLQLKLQLTMFEVFAIV